MNPGPLRRLVGTAGLVCLVPVAWQLWTGGLDPVAAALRAVVVLVVAVAVGRVVSRYLDSVVRSVEADIGVDVAEQVEVVREQPAGDGQRATAS